MIKIRPIHHQRHDFIAVLTAEPQDDDGTQQELQPWRCYIFCPAGDRDRLFEELDAFGATVARRIREQFKPLFDPAAEPLSEEVLAGMLDWLPGETVELRRLPGSHALSLRSGETEYDWIIDERGSFPKLEIPFPEDTVKAGHIKIVTAGKAPRRHCDV